MGFSVLFFFAETFSSRKNGYKLLKLQQIIAAKNGIISELNALYHKLWQFYLFRSNRHYADNFCYFCWHSLILTCFITALCFSFFVFCFVFFVFSFQIFFFGFMFFIFCFHFSSLFFVFHFKFFIFVFRFSFFVFRYSQNGTKWSVASWQILFWFFIIYYMLTKLM